MDGEFTIDTEILHEGKDFFRKIMLKMNFNVEELATFQATLLGEMTNIKLPY